MKPKKNDLKVLIQEEPPSADNPNDLVYFEDRDEIQQEAVIELLASIVKEKYRK